MDPGTRAAAILFTDLAGSTAYKGVAGERRAYDAFLAHDELFRRLLERRGGRLNKDTGDGFLATFPEARDGALCALEFLRDLESLRLDPPLRARAALHLDEIREAPDPHASAGVKLVGAGVDLAAHLLKLAAPGQLLLTAAAFDRIRLRGLSETGLRLRWLHHGPRALKGMDAPVEVFEIGEERADPPPPPAPDPGTASGGLQAAAPAEWRPAAGESPPGRPGWRLIRRLGGGGGGEAWLAAPPDGTGSPRVFKFGFGIRGARALRRELAAGRLLRLRLGPRPEFPALFGHRLEGAAPFAEIEYLEAGDVREWFQSRGPGGPPMAERLAVIRTAAEALALAHSVGMLHRDVKPANILVRAGSAGEPPRGVLADFGSGIRIVPEGAPPADDGIAGLTATAGPGAGSPPSGTLLFIAPELFAGAGPSVQSDIFSLGAAALQTLTGDFLHPAAPGWERTVEDPLLREDLARCLDRDPARRWTSAAEFAHSLARLEERRAEAEAERAAAERRRRLARLNRALAAALAALLLVAAAGGAFILRERRHLAEQIRLRAEAQAAERRTAEALGAARFEEYAAKIATASNLLEAGMRFEALKILAEAPPEHRGWEWGRLARRAVKEDAILVGHRADVRFARFNPDGSRIVSGDNAGEARIWDSKTGKAIRVIPLGGGKVLDGRFDPGGARVVLASESGRVVIADAEGEGLFELKGHAAAVNRAEFNPAGDRVVTASDDKTARIWDARTGGLIAALEGHGAWVTDARFSPDGSSLATSSDDHLARIWSAEGALLHELRGHAGPVNCLAFSPDGRWLVTGGDDARVIRWDAGSGERAGEYGGRERPVRDLRWTLDGTGLLALGPDPWISLWMREASEPSAIFSAPSVWPSTITELRETGWILSASREGVLRGWRRDSVEPVMVLKAAEGSINSLDAAGSESGSVAAATDGPFIRMFSPPGPPEARGLDRNGLTAMAMDPGGEIIAAASANSGLEIQDLETNPRSGGHRSLSLPELDIHRLAFSGDGRILAGAGNRGAWVVRTDDPGVSPHMLPHPAKVRWALPEDAGSRVVTAAEDRRIRIWNSDSGELLWTGPEEPDWSVEGGLIREGTRLFSARRDGAVSFYTLAPEGTGAELESTRAAGLEGDELTAAAIDPAGRRWAAGGLHGGCAVYDAAAGEVLCRFQTSGGDLSFLAFSPEGERVFAGGRRSPLCVYDAATGRLLFTEGSGWAGEGCAGFVLSGEGNRAASFAWRKGFRLLESLSPDDPRVRVAGGRSANVHFGNRVSDF